MHKAVLVQFGSYKTWELNFLHMTVEAAMNDDDVCNSCRYSSESEVSTQFEQLVCGIRLVLPQAAIIIVEAFRQSKAPRNGFTSGQNQHDTISKYYDSQSLVFEMQSGMITMKTSEGIE